MLVRLQQGKRYRADIQLQGIDELATDDYIAGLFGDAGFTDVSVTGNAAARMAVGIWSKPDITVDTEDISPEITDVQEA